MATRQVLITALCAVIARAIFSSIQILAVKQVTDVLLLLVLNVDTGGKMSYKLGEPVKPRQRYIKRYFVGLPAF